MEKIILSLDTAEVRAVEDSAQQEGLSKEEVTQVTMPLHFDLIAMCGSLLFSVLHGQCRPNREMQVWS